MAETRLSDPALGMLRYQFATKDNTGSDENREVHRELVRAGIIFFVSGFISGPEAIFRWTDWGWERRGEWIKQGHT
jgi:hypothetical protein